MYRTVIVEDDPMVSSINAQYLKGDSRFVLTGSFPNGRDALEYMSQNPVDLVIVDYYMPVMNGLEFARACRERDFSAMLIMITAASTVNEIRAALAAGVLDYIVKPFTYDRFQESLQKFIQVTVSMESKATLNQDEIDQLISRQLAPAQETGVKGILPQTLDLVREYLLSRSGAFLTSDEIAKGVSLSRITVRRYLNHLLEQGEIISTVDYTTGGRPCLRYRLR